MIRNAHFLNWFSVPLHPRLLERKLVALLAQGGSIRGTAQVGYAIRPEREKRPQGAALAAGKVLRGLRDRGAIASHLEESRYMK